MPVHFRHLPTNPVMMVHQVTGTYLFPDSYTAVAGQLVQNWAEDPFNASYPNSHKWNLEETADGTRMKCLTSNLALAVHDTPQDKPSFQQDPGSLMESWKFVPDELSPDSYAIVSRVHKDYALSLDGHLQANDRYVVLTRMWGGPNMSQLWKVVRAED